MWCKKPVLKCHNYLKARTQPLNAISARKSNISSMFQELKEGLCIRVWAHMLVTHVFFSSISIFKWPPLKIQWPFNLKQSLLQHWCFYLTNVTLWCECNDARVIKLSAISIALSVTIPTQQNLSSQTNINAE